MRQAPPPLTEQQHLDVAVSVGAVLGHLAAAIAMVPNTWTCVPGACIRPPASCTVCG
jgi:hypothetical protein